MKETTSLKQFVAFLKVYERTRLRSLARHVGFRPHFGFVFDYNRRGAALSYRGQRLGHVRWIDGSITFDPPMPLRTEPPLSDTVFDSWVSRADHRKATEAH